MIHIAFVSTHFRSHFRPLLFTALSLALFDPGLWITVYAPNEVICLADEERDLFGREDHHKVPSNPSFGERVRLVDINNNSGIKNGSGSSTEWEVKFEDTYNALLPFLVEMIHQSSATTPGLQKYDKERNAKNGTQHESYFWLKPKALIFDFLLDIPCILRTLITDQQHTNITLIGYSPGPVTWAFRRLVARDVQEKLQEAENVIANPTMSKNAHEEALKAIFTRTTGSIVDVEGSHRCYDYELIPQLGSTEFYARNMYIVYKAAHHLRRCDAALFSTSPDFEPGMASKLQKELNKPVFQIGPQFPQAWWYKDLMSDESPDRRQLVALRSLPNFPQSTSNLRVEMFLNDIYQRLGPRRVLYISFGSVYSMEKRPDLIETLLHTLIAFNERSTENKIPFVFATATTSHFISAALREKAENLGIGHFCAFAPQHSILNHPATGWFLTHGGASGVHEALFNAIPLILWPATTDQPIVAAQVALNLRCGIELIQVRTGPSQGKETVRGVRNHGDTFAIQSELVNTLEMVLPSECITSTTKAICVAQDIKQRTIEVARKLRKSHDSGGECHTAINRLSNFIYSKIN